MKAKRLWDKDISDANFARFARCLIVRNGTAVCFKYPSQDTYEVDIADILSWFERPHYLCLSKHAENWPADRSYARPAGIRIKGGRRVLRGHAIRLYMTDDTAYDVAWDTVLMACEPRYQWFGGLSSRSR
jgi:hypothetical protein